MPRAQEDKALAQRAELGFQKMAGVKLLEFEPPFFDGIWSVVFAHGD
jgi:hypothetical protein